MDQTNLKNIKEAFITIGHICNNLKMYLEIFEIYSDKILLNIEKRNQYIDKVNYSKFIKNIELKKENLEELITDIRMILEQTKLYDMDNINSQYELFLINEIVNYQWNNLSYLDDYNLNMVKGFIDKIYNDASIIFNNEDYQSIDALQNISSTFSVHMELLQSKISAVKIFDKIKDIESNIVMIGANGSGKSTFARNLKGKFTDAVTIISAQHLLLYQKQETISTNNKDLLSVHEFQSNNKLGSDSNLLQLFSNDFNNLICALFAENTDREHNYYYGYEEKQESILLKAIRLWNDIIVHRRLIPLKYSIEVSTLEGTTYDFNYLSDGEKAVFYYISHVLLSKPNAYIIIDEPENHLHLTICNKLWDKLEFERCDCKFVYITHNLDFAISRKNRVVLWNKKFKPYSDWDFIPLPQDEQIPESLLMELLGSRRKILFCEGDDKSSLDYRLYSILFKNYTIIPVGGHLNVINYCTAYNNNKLVYGQEAFGIIDGDFHMESEIEKWQKSRIFTLRTNEIENILCDENILKNALTRFCCPNNVIQLFKDEFFKILEKNKEKESVMFANSKFNHFLKGNMLSERKDINSLKNELQKLLNNDLLNICYSERLKTIEKIINEKNYGEAIHICSLKKILTRELANKIIVSNFEDRILTLIEGENSLQEYLKVNYFSFMLNIEV